MARLVVVLAVVAAAFIAVACETATGGAGGATGTGGSGAAGHAMQFVGEPRVVVDAGGTRVEGRIKNTAARPYSGYVKATLFDAAGTIVATASGAFNGVQPGEEVTYGATGSDRPAAWARVAVQVDLERPDPAR